MSDLLGTYNNNRWTAGQEPIVPVPLDTPHLELRREAPTFEMSVASVVDGLGVEEASSQVIKMVIKASIETLYRTNVRDGLKTEFGKEPSEGEISIRLAGLVNLDNSIRAVQALIDSMNRLGAEERKYEIGLYTKVLERLKASQLKSQKESDQRP